MAIFDTMIGTAAISFIFAYLATPVMTYIAQKTNLLDKPTKKKSHAHPTPLLGGVAVFFAFIAALSFARQSDKALIGALVGGTVLVVTGIVDDKYGMGPKIKLRVQVIAALIAVIMGVRVVFIKVPPLSILFTIAWMVGMTNSFNLLDNLNGLSAGIAGISAFFFGVIAFIHGDAPVALVSFALMGSCFGFLLHNFPKARIFMGDCGSLFLGFMLAFIAVWGSWKTTSVTTSLAIPILVLSYPLFDTVLVTIKRLQVGRSIFQGGRDHSSHRLAILGFKKKRAVLVLYAVSFALGLAALAMTVVGPYFDMAIMVIAFVLLLLFGIQLGRVRIKYKT